MKNIILNFLIFLTPTALLGCKTPIPNTSESSIKNCIPQIDRSIGQIIVLTFIKDNKLLSMESSKKYPTELNSSAQHGYLNIHFTHYSQDPVLEDQFIFVHQEDTMKLKVILHRTLNHFIDSIPFRKGEFYLTPETSMLGNDPYYLEYSKYLYGAGIRKEPFYKSQSYLNYVNNSGITLLKKQEEISSNSKVENPFEGQYYCQKDLNINSTVSAENYISDVLGQSYIEFKIRTLEKVAH